MSFRSLPDCDLSFLLMVDLTFAKCHRKFGCLPCQTSEAYVKPIYKNSSVVDVKYYRPKFLTCVTANVMEAIVHEQMISYLLKNELISKHQHGFLAKRSTCTNLLDSAQDWILALKDRNDIDVTFIDFSKVDSVSHPKLLHKLAGYGIQYELLLTWIENRLKDRTQRA